MAEKICGGVGDTISMRWRVVFEVDMRRAISSEESGPEVSTRNLRDRSR